ncbi:MAG: type II toxin-antitoxin system VapC family toxin [Desulfuromonadales bacterium]|nr:type II toxin-antitoxin system VapC family toxin [Desulfuromonadales bacterium]
MNLVVDASVLIKGYLPESGSEQAADLLARFAAGEVHLLAPELLLAEVGNILWKRVRRQDLTSDEAREIGQAMAALPLQLVPTQPVLTLALELALLLDITVYDAIYVAVSKVHGVPLLTADERLVARLAPLHGEVRTQLL